jgi:hypothetical protein
VGWNRSLGDYLRPCCCFSPLTPPTPEPATTIDGILEPPLLGTVFTRLVTVPAVFVLGAPRGARDEGLLIAGMVLDDTYLLLAGCALALWRVVPTPVRVSDYSS